MLKILEDVILCSTILRDRLSTLLNIKKSICFRKFPKYKITFFSEVLDEDFMRFILNIDFRDCEIIFWKF